MEGRPTRRIGGLNGSFLAEDYAKGTGMTDRVVQHGCTVHAMHTPIQQRIRVMSQRRLAQFRDL
eukprot:scaffold407_cov168-Amphora_coffeaeformis.AAC.11